MTSRRRSEKDLTQALRRWLTRRGFLVVPEVRVQPYSIDLVAFKPSTRSLSAVEVKLKNWKKAIRQSALNTSFVELSYVAMPERHAEKILKVLKPNSGLGVLSLRITPNRILVRLAKEAVKDGKPNPHFRRSVISKLASHYGGKLLQ